MERLIYLLLAGFLLFSCNDPSPSSDTSNTNATDSGSKKDAISEEPVRPSSKNYPLPNWPLTPENTKGKLFPYDEALNDKSLIAFRQAIYNAVKEKDIDFLLSKVPDNISYSFGDDDGKKGFIRKWNLDNNPEFTGLWEELGKCLELGGAFYDGDKNAFFAPYVFLSEELDPFENGVVIGDNVRLREATGSSSKVVGSLSWDKFTLVEYEGDYEVEEINGESFPWIPVKTDNGEQGFVFAKYLRTPGDYRAGFSKNKAGDWMMHVFIVGD